jgi:ABC-type nitrate/sulfonate/bicarbonate transport system permease component
MNKRLRGIGNRIWFPVSIIVLWQFIQSKSSNPFFPTPSKIWESVQYLVTPQWLFSTIGSSLVTLLVGFFVGSSLGVLFGAILGANEYLREIFLPITNFIRCIPSVAKVPVVISILGLGQFTRMASVIIAVLFPMLLSTLRAVGNTDPKLIENSKLFGFGFWRTLLQLRVPAATGEILAGLQAALQVAVLVTIFSEMLHSEAGLGAFIVRAQNTFVIPDVWLGAIVIGIMGVILNGTFFFLERKLAPWYFAEKKIT